MSTTNQLDLTQFEGHAPGPWEWAEYKWRGGWSGLCDAGNYEVLFPYHCNEGDTGDAWFDPENLTEANRKLIAAAPDLLSALTAANAREARLREALTDIVTPVTEETVRALNAAREFHANPDTPSVDRVGLNLVCYHFAAILEKSEAARAALAGEG